MFLSIGSNGDNAAGQVTRAMEAILAMAEVREIGRGRLYKTEPQGMRDQPWFINTALAVETSMEPAEILKRIKQIESQLGRKPGGERWGPREIDIDIIYYGNRIVDMPGLAIPHPMAAKRRFVLAPLADIDPGLVHPVLKKTVSQLLAELPEEGQAVEPVAP